MTHADLVRRATRWLRNTMKCPVVFAEIVTYASCNPDAIGWRGSRERECHFVECKRTRSDFFRDRKKQSHLWGTVPGTHRWYMTPPGLVGEAEIPPGWGLLEVHSKIVRVVVRAQGVEEPARGDEITILLSAIRRHQIGVKWRHAEARFDTVASALEPQVIAKGAP